MSANETAQAPIIIGKANVKRAIVIHELIAERDALREERDEKQRQCDVLKLALDAEVNKGVVLRAECARLQSALKSALPLLESCGLAHTDKPWPVLEQVRDALK